MAISFRKYVDIASGVGAGARVKDREFILRLFTRNELVPAGVITAVNEAAEVARLAGYDSEEYARAAFYFGWISKSQTRARRLDLVRWPEEAIAASLRGGLVALPGLALLQGVSSGSFALQMDGRVLEVVGLDFSGASSFADIAEMLQSAIRAGGPNDFWTGATVVYSAALKAFVLTAGEAGPCAISAVREAQSGLYIGGLLRWDTASMAVVSQGMEATSVAAILDYTTGLSNNFGSLIFCGDIGLEQAVQAASFAGLSNMQHMYCQRATANEAPEWAAALDAYDGVALTEYDPSLDEFPEMCPAIMLAATDYTRVNSTLNYMFHQFNLTPTVSTTEKSDALDALRVNYYGRTQEAGQYIDFYQRGVLQGPAQDMNIYANEMWLKARCGAEIMTLLLNLPKVSANLRGKGQVLGALGNVITMALENGVISVGKTLSYVQRAFVTEIAGDSEAWRALEQIGYWLDAKVEQYTVDDRVEYKITYLLLYAKDDVIRKVEGTHSLI